MITSFVPGRFRCWRCLGSSAIGEPAPTRLKVRELHRDLRIYYCERCGADNVLERTPMEWAAIDRHLTEDHHVRQ
jgi:hypothetical protein